MSLTRNSIRLEQLFATVKNDFVISHPETKGSKMSSEFTMPFKGFLNSCAAEAKARVLILDIYF
jgi:hypothetical protein